MHKHDPKLVSSALPKLIIGFAIITKVWVHLLSGQCPEHSKEGAPRPVAKLIDRPSIADKT